MDFLKGALDWVVQNGIFVVLGGAAAGALAKPALTFVSSFGDAIDKLAQDHSPAIVRAHLLPVASLAACIAVFANVKPEDLTLIGVVLVLVVAAYATTIYFVPAVTEWRWPKAAKRPLSAAIVTALVLPIASVGAQIIYESTRPLPARSLYVAAVSAADAPPIPGGSTTAVGADGKVPSFFSRLRGPLSAVWPANDKMIATVQDAPPQPFDAASTDLGGVNAVDIDQWAEKKQIPKPDYAAFPSLEGTGPSFRINLYLWGRNDPEHNYIRWNSQIPGLQWPLGYENAAAEAASIEVATYMLGQAAGFVDAKTLKTFSQNLASGYCGELADILKAHPVAGAPPCTDFASIKATLKLLNDATKPAIAEDGAAVAKRGETLLHFTCDARIGACTI